MNIRTGKSNFFPLSKEQTYKGNLLTRTLNKLLLALVWFYRKVISPHTARSCRFHPSCSQYTIEALKKYGPLKGTSLAAKRISRCHPWNPGGHDPVP